MPLSGTTARAPRPLTSFVGRDEQLAELRALLARDDVRLVTLTGPGGVGKTRLATRIANTMIDPADGVWFVPLSSVRDVSLLEPTIARALQITEGSGSASWETLVATLRRYRGLLILDNFEQLLAAAPLVADLVATCPALTLLVTSRAVLHLSGEHVFEVPPMSLPDSGQAPSFDELSASEAIRLFVERAQELRPDYTPTTDELLTIGTICHRLNGLPLAIELAAARIAVLPPAALLTRLQQRMAILTGGPRDAPARHRTMRDAVAWSHDLLDPSEQALFRRLAVFVGGFSVFAAERIAEWPSGGGEEAAPGGLAPRLTVDVLSSLVDQSLVRRISHLHDPPEPRFEMLEIIREFAQEHLKASGEEIAMRDAHAAVMLEFAREGETHLVREVDPAWLDRLEADHANLRSALEWTLSTHRTPDSTILGVELAGTLWLFWYYHSHLREGRVWLERALAVTAPAPPAAQARILVGLGTLLHYLGELAEATVVLARGTDLLRELGDPSGTAYALTAIGNVAEDDGRFDEASASFTEANALFSEIGDQVNVAVTLYHLGVVAFGQHNLPLALERLEEALALSRHMGDPWSTAASLGYRGLVLSELGDSGEAAAALGESLDLYIQLGTTERIIEILRRVAVLAELRKEHEPALRLLAAADAVGRSIGIVQALPERTVYERAAASAKREISPEQHETASNAGAALSMTNAIDEARLQLQARTSPQEVTDTNRSLHLTERELQVLSRIVEGKTDSEIAAELSISRRTTTTHVGHIFTKLDVSSRAAAVAYALRHGLV